MNASLTPLVVLVSPDVARRVETLTAARWVAVADHEARTTIEQTMAQNGWTPEMLVAGQLLAAALLDPSAHPVQPQGASDE